MITANLLFAIRLARCLLAVPTNHASRHLTSTLSRLDPVPESLVQTRTRNNVIVMDLTGDTGTAGHHGGCLFRAGVKNDVSPTT
jgi:hypothetical protein